MKILLVCNAGMSTGIMQMKLEEEAKKHNIEANIEAVPMSELDDFLKDTDVILLGPQIRFAEKEIKIAAKDIPVIVIAVQDFGMMRADRVFKQVLDCLK